MSLELVTFVMLSAGLLGTAVIVLIARNPIHSAISLIASFFCLAGLYLTLNASFVAVIQVLVYAGAIMVLFLFVIMLLNLSEKDLGDAKWNFGKVMGVGAVLMLGCVLIWAIVGANKRYLNEPAVNRFGAFETLQNTAAKYSFTSANERGAYFEQLLRLRVMASQKVRLQMGTAEAQEDACRVVSRYDLSISPSLCVERSVQESAKSYAITQLVNLDEQLASLEAVVDASNVPAAWRGDNADRIPGSEPTREEWATLLVVEIVYANRLDQLVDVAAKPVLSPEELSALDALAVPANLTQPSNNLHGADLRALATMEPGARFKVAQQRFDELNRRVDQKVREAEGFKTFVVTSERLIADYRRDAAEVLGNRRSGRTDLVMSKLIALQSQARGRFTAVERDLVREVLRSLSSSGPRHLAAMSQPALYNKDDFGSVRAVGRQFFTTYLLPFEVTSVLLLVGILGAVVIAKRRM
ncbi:MAG: hypothetical protein AUK47_12675 [Deltaproteobacteria bacterium CG2_30_63_29]|nr:MAG: hypothetical protein AUK47_12675 [Deltaproteobacteria bacterium CG2_30_63_29]